MQHDDELRIRQCDRAVTAQLGQCPADRLVRQAEMIGDIQPAHRQLQAATSRVRQMPAQFEQKVVRVHRPQLRGIGPRAAHPFTRLRSPGARRSARGVP